MDDKGGELVDNLKSKAEEGSESSQGRAREGNLFYKERESKVNVVFITLEEESNTGAVFISLPIVIKLIRLVET